MNLADERLKELDSPTLTGDERTLLRCRLAGDFINAGHYEAAREALGELWPGVGRRPEVNQLPPANAAEVLLQCGVLSGWLGSAQAIPGAQERAKDLLSEAFREFQSEGLYEKASEVQYELSMCYWRLGAYDEARVLMSEALWALKDADVELKAKIFLRRTLVEIWEHRYYEALNILKEAEPVFEAASDALKGRWHGQKGLVLRRLATAEGRADYPDGGITERAAAKGRADYFDRAIIEYTAAIYHYEQAGHERYCAVNLNNLAMLLYKLGRYKDAHEHLDRARRIFTNLRDPGNVAQVDETRSRVLVAEGKYREASRIIGRVIQTFDQSGESALLADALTVQGVVCARLGDNDTSISTLRRAMNVAEEAGALTNAGLAGLTLIEEHGTRLPFDMMRAIYKRADELLSVSAGREDLLRLRACARRIATADNSSIISSLIMEAKETPFHSCFISYNHKDQEFVERLYSRLKDSRVPVWFDAKDVKGGRKLHEQIVKEIREHDKLLIILSKHSLQSDWVKTEIREALKGSGRRKRARLFPIRLVSMDVIKKWECFDADSGKDLAHEVRKYPISDFSDWRNHGSFEASADRLIKDLQKEEALLKLSQPEDLLM
jgi:tetratricopeptide (TPR) repeat protein